MSAASTDSTSANRPSTRDSGDKHTQQHFERNNSRQQDLSRQSWNQIGKDSQIKNTAGRGTAGTGNERFLNTSTEGLYPKHDGAGRANASDPSGKGKSPDAKTPEGKGNGKDFPTGAKTKKALKLEIQIMAT